MLRSVVVPSPSRPWALKPQHHAPPSSVIAQLKLLPAPMAIAPLPRPDTATGTLRRVVVPSPSWPLLLKPQHSTAPACVSAQVWYEPMFTAATPLPRPVTATGRELLALAPCPSWPEVPRPQHTRPRLAVMAQLISPKASSAMTPASRPTTSTGKVLEVVVPSPSWPEKLPPQQRTAPALVSAQL